MDSYVLKSIKDRDKAFYAYTHDTTAENVRVLQKSEIKLSQTFLKQNKNYFKNALGENKFNSKSLWNSLKLLGLPSKM